MLYASVSDSSRKCARLSVYDNWTEAIEASPQVSAAQADIMSDSTVCALNEAAVSIKVSTIQCGSLARLDSSLKFKVTLHGITDGIVNLSI